MYIWTVSLKTLKTAYLLLLYIITTDSWFEWIRWWDSETERHKYKHRLPSLFPFTRYWRSPWQWLESRKVQTEYARSSSKSSIGGGEAFSSPVHGEAKGEGVNDLSHKTWIVGLILYCWGRPDLLYGIEGFLNPRHLHESGVYLTALLSWSWFCVLSLSPNQWSVIGTLEGSPDHGKSGGWNDTPEWGDSSTSKSQNVHSLSVIVGSQEAGDFLDCVLCLTIGLEIITRVEADVNLQEVKEGAQDLKNKLLPLICHNVFKQARGAEQMIEQGLCHLQCCVKSPEVN